MVLAGANCFPTWWSNMQIHEVNGPGELAIDPDLIGRFTAKGGGYEIVPEMG